MYSTSVYLAGPIQDQNKQDALEWRLLVQRQLEFFGIGSINPLRNEPTPPHTLTYDVDPHGLFTSPRAIDAKNMYDVKSCDLMLAYLPEHAEPVGTLIEIGLGRAYHKPIVAVTIKPRYLKCPLLQGSCGWIVPDFDTAIGVIQGLLCNVEYGEEV